MPSPIYLDYNATTPCDSGVLEDMLPYFGTIYGNPSSNHSFGWLAKHAVEEATAEIAGLLGRIPEEFIYTSGSTESINTILKGVARSRRSEGNHILTTKAEHKAVLDCCAALEAEGFDVTYLDVDQDGLVPIEVFRSALRPETTLAAIMYANNETGVIQPLHDIAESTHANGTCLFADTTQALGKVPLDEVLDLVDFACFSGHKVYGPKGIGLTFRNRNTAMNLPAFIHGGGQQKGQRGGTINTPHIVGLASAIRLVLGDMDQEADRIRRLRDRLEAGLLAIELANSNYGGGYRLPNTLNVSFPYVDGAGLLNYLGNKMAVSNGSACNSASVEPSHVLLAMGVARSLAYATLRFSLGRFTTEEEVERAIRLTSEAVNMLRQDNILWERRK